MNCTVFNIPAEELKRLYEDEKLSFAEIGKIYGTNAYLVRYHAIKNGVKIRSVNRVQFPISNEELIDLYINQCKTGAEIEQIIGINKNTVMNKLRSLGVKLRPNGNIPDKKYHFKSPRNKIYFNDDKLKEMYLSGSSNEELKNEFHCGIGAIKRRIKEMGLQRPEEIKKKLLSQSMPDISKDYEISQLYKSGKSAPQISKIVGKSPRTVLNRLHKNNISVRTLSESQFNYFEKEIPKELADPETLYDLYVVDKMSKKDLGNKFNVSPKVIDRYLKLYGIHIRGNSDARKGLYCGDRHPNWKGGRTGIYLRLREYFYDNQVQDILKRDHYKCQCCGSKNKLQVHHIIPFKQLFDEILKEHSELDIIKNESEVYDLMTKDSRLNNYDNLITYCKECHLFKIHGYKKSQKCHSDNQIN